MKRHVRIYLKHFGYGEQSFMPCEIPNCNRRAVDVNHIDARGMGGSKTKDFIENLMGMCREHHVEFGDIKSKKDWLKEVHKKFMLANAA